MSINQSNLLPEILFLVLPDVVEGFFGGGWRPEFVEGVFDELLEIEFSWVCSLYEVDKLECKEEVEGGLSSTLFGVGYSVTLTEVLFELDSEESPSKLNASFIILLLVNEELDLELLIF
jgi:hypothetical protein